MTAKEEDILTNQSYIQKGTVLDKLLESVIVSKDVKIDDLIVGDKNALLIATRILGYGKDYEFMLNNKPETVDLSTLDNKEFDTTGLTQGVNEFSFTLPHSNQEITYKILTGKDEKAVERELAGIKRIKKDASPELSTRLKHLIVSVDGKSEKKDVRDFVDNYLLARDSRALREHIKNTQPDVDLNVVLDSGEEVRIPIGLSFFWPDA
tara:strand:- start:1873 stop:2496 length:624 start_codon:yes stop_codon:yes gene_type:complete